MCVCVCADVCECAHDTSAHVLCLMYVYVCTHVLCRCVSLVIISVCQYGVCRCILWYVDVICLCISCSCVCMMCVCVSVYMYVYVYAYMSCVRMHYYDCVIVLSCGSWLI